MPGWLPAGVPRRKLKNSKNLLTSETAIDRRDVGDLTELDFKFHLFIAISFRKYGLSPDHQFVQRGVYPFDQPVL